MAASHWHRLYAARVDAPPTVLFKLLSDLPSYGAWLSRSDQFGRTTSVSPYPIELGSRYHDGRPDESGRSWWGTVTGFQPPGSLDFHHTITVKEVRATVDVHIHYSLEPLDGDPGRTLVSRWLVLDIVMPVVLKALRPLITSSFDKENVRVMAALEQTPGLPTPTP